MGPWHPQAASHHPLWGLPPAAYLLSPPPCSLSLGCGSDGDIFSDGGVKETPGLLSPSPPPQLRSATVMSNSATPRTAAHQASLSITNSQSLLKLMFIELVMPSNHLILCHPLLLLPSIFPSIRVSSSESALSIRWPKYWSFTFCIRSSNECSWLISFRIDWFDLLAVQGILKSLLFREEHHSSKASILQCSTFFMVQLSDPYMPTGKTMSLTRQTFVGKVMSLLFNMLSSHNFPWS